MTAKILVAIAGYIADEHVFNEAIKLANNKGKAAKLLLLHILPHGATHEKAAKEFLQLRADEAKALGITVERRIDFGDPGLSICHHASDWGANFIVIGHRGRTTWTELALGSVSAYVTRHAPKGCSVFVVRPWIKILVAMESREKDEYVFDHAKSLATQLHADMILLHILTAQENKNWGDQDDSGSIVSEELALLAHETTVNGIPTEFDLKSGDHNTGRDICECASNWDAKLIVIGSRQHSNFEENNLGPVSQQVVKSAPCSVMLVHPLKEAG